MYLYTKVKSNVEKFTKLAMVAVTISTALSGCATADKNQEDSKLIYTWLYDKAKQEHNFLAVLNGDPNSSEYGQLISTVKAGAKGIDAHHTNHKLPASGILFANEYKGGRTFIFDTKINSYEPKLVTEFTNRNEYTFPHSFEELPNGNVLSTFQTKGDGNKVTGGLVELTPKGEFVRASDAEVSNVVDMRPYSLEVMPEIDRIVTTNLDMKDQVEKGKHVQIWRLSDLKLLHTLKLPDGPRGKESWYPMEPRALNDGKTVMLNTLACSMFIVYDIESEKPKTKLVYDFQGVGCALPVVIGNYWVQALGTNYKVAVLDVSNPHEPREVSSISFPENYLPHWLARDAEGVRIVMTGYSKMDNRVSMLKFDKQTGKIEVDPNFGQADEILPGFFTDNLEWPHGFKGHAVPHGTVFKE